MNLLVIDYQKKNPPLQERRLFTQKRKKQNKHKTCACCLYCLAFYDWKEITLLAREDLSEES